MRQTRQKLVKLDRFIYDTFCYWTSRPAATIGSSSRRRWVFCGRNLHQSCVLPSIERQASGLHCGETLESTIYILPKSGALPCCPGIRGKIRHKRGGIINLEARMRFPAFRRKVKRLVHWNCELLVQGVHHFPFIRYDLNIYVCFFYVAHSIDILN